MAGPAETATACDLDRLAEDWIALWQSELAGIAADPALAEAWSAALALQKALTMAALNAFATPQHEKPVASPTARPTPATVAPDAVGAAGLGSDGDAAARLAARIAELEQRLARLEARPGGSGANRRGPRRKPAPA